MSDEKHSISLIGDQKVRDIMMIARLKKFSPNTVIDPIKNDLKEAVDIVEKETAQANVQQNKDVVDLNNFQASLIRKATVVSNNVNSTHTKVKQISKIISKTFDENEIVDQENLGAAVLRNVLLKATGNHLNEKRNKKFVPEAAHKLSIKWRSYVHEKGLYKVLHAVVNYNPISLAICHKQLYFSPALNDNIQDDTHNDAQSLRGAMENDAQTILDEMDKKYPKITI